MDLEEVFSSKLRMKILKLIYDLGSLNVSDIARRLNTNFTLTSQHLKVLEAGRNFAGARLMVGFECTDLMKVRQRQRQWRI